MTPSSSPEAGPAGDLAIVMSGGGARAAYQVGFLRAVSRRLPDLRPEILTGVSAGAINAVHLASHSGRFAESVEELARAWGDVTPERVMQTRPESLVRIALQWALRLASGGRYRPQSLRGFIDTQPLRALLHEVYGSENGALGGIGSRIAAGDLRSIAVTATSYTTGQSVTFCQGREVQDWERPNRRSRVCELTVDHVLASSALPILFPAIRVADAWYGDGGIRLMAPLSPAIHLGAQRIFAISTRHGRSRAEADERVVTGYPPPAQVASVLLNSVFLDQLDGDALRLQVTNRLLERLPPEDRGMLRPIALQIWRPSQDLGRLANDYEVRLPRALRFLARGTGTLETRSNDLLSLIMFQHDYLKRLLEMGERDAQERLDEIAAFLDPDGHGAKEAG